jgi:gliding motility-associated-like protein
MRKCLLQASLLCMVSLMYFTLAQAQCSTTPAPAVIPSAAPELCPGESLTLYVDTGNVWHRQPDIPAAGRVAATSFSIGSKGYVCTGYNNASTTYYADCWEYDDASGTWSQKADLPGPARAYAVGFALNNKGYVGLGNNPTLRFNTFFEYDPATNTWAAKANYPGGGRTSAAAFTIGSLGYVGLGQSATGYPAEYWSFNPATDQWTPISSFPASGRREATSFRIDAKGYVTCGWNTGTVNTNDCWQYDAIADAWTVQPSLPADIRRSAAAFTVGNHAYVAGGFTTAGGNTTELWEFYNGVWTRKADYPGVAQWGQSGLSLPGKGLLVLGSVRNAQTWTYHPNKTVQWPNGSTQPSITISTTGAYSATLYDVNGCSVTTEPLNVIAQPIPATIGFTGSSTMCEGQVKTLSARGDQWTRKSDLPLAGRYATGFSIGGFGYYCGGNTNATQMWKYNPASDTWSKQATLPMNIGVSPAITWKGKAFLIGSQDKMVWIYDPTNDGWTRKAAFPGTARQIVQGFLLNDQLIVAGGLNTANNTALAEVWAYDLINDTWTRKNDMPYGMAYAPAFALNGYGYVCTGNSTRDGNATVTAPQSAVCLRYDPVADSWTVMPDFPGGVRGGAIAFTDGNKAFVGMGNRGTLLNDLWQLNPTTLTWTRVQNIPAGRYGAASFVIGGKGYVATGSITSGFGVDVWQYELPYNYRWSTGATTRTIQVTQTGDYSLTISNDEGCSMPTPAVHITVQPNTRIQTPPTNAAVCTGMPAQFTVAATGVNLTYRWRLNGNPLAESNSCTGTNTSTLTVSGTATATAGRFSCEVTGDCGSITTPDAILTVYALPAKPVITWSSSLSLCPGGSVELSGPTAVAYNWSTGAITQRIMATQPGIYSLQIMDANNCRSPISDPVTVQYSPLPTGNITVTGPTLSGNTHVVQLTAPFIKGGQYKWSNGDTTRSIQVSQSGQYSVIVTTTAGCQTTFTIPVQLIDLTKVPNTFSPNGDGVNDVWKVKALDDFPNASVQVFNRNGSKVFEAKGTGIQWNGRNNGKELPAGVYYYVLDLKDGSKAISGWINLLR